jgi:hypothetical protein
MAQIVTSLNGGDNRIWREADVHLGGEVGGVLDACTASGNNSKYLLTSSPAGIANRSWLLLDGNYPFNDGLAGVDCGRLKS